MGNRVTLKLHQSSYLLAGVKTLHHEIEVSDDQGSECFDCVLPPDLLNHKFQSEDPQRLYAWLATALVEDGGLGLEKVSMLLGWRGVLVKTKGGEYGWFESNRTVEEVAATAESLERVRALEGALPLTQPPASLPRVKL